MAGIEVIALGQYDVDTAPSGMHFLPQYIWNRKAARVLRESIARMDAADSVVHVHAFAKAVSPSIGSVLAKSPVPAVYTMHEFFLVCPTGGFYDYRAALPCHRKPLSASCIVRHCDSRSYAHKLLRVGRQALINHGGLHAAFKHIIMISELQHQAARPYLSDAVSYHRVDNPLDITDPGPKERPGRDFLFVGRLSGEKGIEHFCEAARQAGVEAVITSDGPMADDPKARYPQARFLGWQSPEQVLALLCDARALVFPSVWYGGQPLTVYEALAMGTPVIVSDVCAGREAVVDGRNGYWFKSADAEDLARALRKVRDDDTAAAVTRAAHADYWASPLTLQRHLDAIEGVYETMLGRGGQTRPVETANVEEALAG